MLEDTLARLNPFVGLDTPELRTLARHARVLTLPANRWVLQSGRTLRGRYYLLQGCLQLWEPERCLTSRADAAADAFYPGCRAARAGSPVQLLQVDTDPIAFLLQRQPELELRLLPGELWVQRLLGHELIRRLAPIRWQRLLRKLEPQIAVAGQRIIVQGDPGDSFYVLREGEARVHRGQRTLALLRPGDFFGEDAVLARTPRNASVTMLTSGRLMRLPRSAFLDVLVHGVVQHQALLPAAGPEPAVCVLSLARRPTPGRVPVALGRMRDVAARLDKDKRYLVGDGPMPARALAVFLLLQAGLDAAVLITDSRSAIRREQSSVSFL